MSKPRKKSRIPIIIFIIFIIIGMLIMLYPVICNFINSRSSQSVIKSYSTSISSYDKSRYDALMQAAMDYNSKLSGTTVVDAFSSGDDDESQEYNNILNISDTGIMGYIEIPKIDVKIPIYHGTSTKVLQKGAGHLKDSSFPIGGASTHAILAGHRGLPTSRLFTDLNQLKVGDLFYIYILDKTLAYQVDKVQIVEPSNVEPLRLQEGKDYVTLVTCTPYAVNTHRLLVRGTRVEYKKEVLENIHVENKASTADIIFYVGLAVALIIIIIVIIISRKTKKKSTKNIPVICNNDDEVLEII